MRKALALLLLPLAACSTYERDWEAAAAPPRPGAIEGRWEGLWQSAVDGHTGELRCLVSPRPDGGLDARYHATYTWCLLPFTFDYTVPMTAERSGDIWRFRGSAELGCWIAGGLYTYEGQAGPAGYEATYRSEEDRGVFRLRRPPATPPRP